MKNSMKILAAGFLLAWTPMAAQASPVELVLNGGFEDGLTGWSCTGADWCRTDGIPHSGSGALITYDKLGFGTLTQTIATTVGTEYDFSFWSFESYKYEHAGNILRYSIDGALPTTALTTLSYAQTTDSFVASGASAVISFFIETDHGTGHWTLDDVSVTAAIAAVPLPAAFPLFAAGLGAMGFAARRKKRPANS